MRNKIPFPYIEIGKSKDVFSFATYLRSSLNLTEKLPSQQRFCVSVKV